MRASCSTSTVAPTWPGRWRTRATLGLPPVQGRAAARAARRRSVPRRRGHRRPQPRHPRRHRSTAAVPRRGVAVPAPAGARARTGRLRPTAGRAPSRCAARGGWVLRSPACSLPPGSAPWPWSTTRRSARRTSPRSGRRRGRVGQPRSDAAVAAARRTAAHLRRDATGDPAARRARRSTGHRPGRGRRAARAWHRTPAGHPARDDRHGRSAGEPRNWPVPSVHRAAPLRPRPRLAPGRGSARRRARGPRDPRVRHPRLGSGLRRRAGHVRGVPGGVDGAGLARPSASSSRAGRSRALDEPGTAYVLRLPGGRPRRRTYVTHPHCGCAWGG